jgi:hypothetical protein
LWELAINDAFFVVRQHQVNVHWESDGDEQFVGEIASGRVFEQPITIHDDFGNCRQARRVRIELNEATRDGDESLAILTNLPNDVSALQVATGYGDRWSIETAFAEIKKCLHGEINALGYPRAALFSFAMALFSYNILSLILTALRSAHGVQVIEDSFSTYHLATEIQAAWVGMMICLPPSVWHKRFNSLPAAKIAEALLALARNIKLTRFRKVTRKKRSPPPKRTYNKNQPHVSTYRIIKDSR